jgi:hypothetical protein
VTLGQDLLGRLERDSHGARVLRLLRDPRADVRRGGRRAPQIGGALPGAAVTADALVDLAIGRVPPRVDVAVSLPPLDLADEVRRRVRGFVVVRSMLGAVELRAPATEPAPFWVRLLPLPGVARAEPLTDPALTVRAARLGLDGELFDSDGDLAAGRLRLTDADALERRPEALLHLARLAVRPGTEVDGSTLAAAVAARRSGAPRTARLAHLGPALADLLAAPDAPEALSWLQELAPELPLAERVRVDLEALRQAAAAPAASRTEALLRALAPGATRRTLESFIRGTHLEWHGC